MKSNPSYLSNLFNDPSLQGRKGRRILKTPEKPKWKNMTIIDQPEKQRSISPTFSKRLQGLNSHFELSHSISPTRSPSNQSILPKHLAQSTNTQPTLRRAFKPILINGEIRDSNKTSSSHILKSGWETQYKNRKLPIPNQH